MKWFAPSQRSSKHFALCAINPKHGKTEHRNPGFSPRDPSRGREGKRDGNGGAELHAAAAFCLRLLHPSAAKTSFCYQRGILLDLASSKTESFWWTASCWLHCVCRLMWCTSESTRVTPICLPGKLPWEQQSPTMSCWLRCWRSKQQIYSRFQSLELES